MQIREFRQRLHLLLTEPETTVLNDEDWYERFWELLDPVVNVRAGRSLAESLTPRPPDELPAEVRDTPSPLWD